MKPSTGRVSSTYEFIKGHRDQFSVQMMCRVLGVARAATVASLLLQEGTLIMYVSRQLGHKDASVTLRVYAHWLPEASNERRVDALDDRSPDVTRRHHAPSTKAISAC